MSTRQKKTILVLFAVGFMFASCSPSSRRTYQSDNSFLRCFDMDYNPGVQIKAKQQCWSVWIEKYVYNQPKDKIEYAKLRLNELNNNVSIPGPPGPPGMFFKRPVPKIPNENVDAKIPNENVDAKIPNENVDAKIPNENVETKIPNENVDAKIPNENVDASTESN